MKLPWNSIKGAWEFFSVRVISSKAPQIQKDEMNKAFYAGASACFELVMSFTNYSDDEAELKMTQLNLEFINYAKGLR